MTLSDLLVTDRLILRRWQPEDVAPMAAINTDPAVTQFLNRPIDRAAVAAFVAVMIRQWDELGYGPWVVQLRGCRDDGPMIGFAGLARIPPYLAAASSGPELGWRLSRSAWGRGYATEAARAARDDALARLNLPEVVSIIHPDNLRSRRVATKLGMHRDRRVDNPLLSRTVDVWTLDHDNAALAGIT